MFQSMKKIVLVLAVVIALSASAFAKNVVVMFFDGSFFHEEAKIYRPLDWYNSNYGNPTTLKRMYADGWRVVGFNGVANANQFFIILEKD